MTSLAIFPGCIVLFAALWDAFETIILPTRVPRKFRLTLLFYRSTWPPWRALSQLFREAKRRELFLSHWCRTPARGRDSGLPTSCHKVPFEYSNGRTGRILSGSYQKSIKRFVDSRRKGAC